QSLLTAVQSSMYMDSGLDPLSLARQMENLSADNIVGQTMPTDGFGTSDTGSSILKVSPSEVKAFFNKLIGSGDTKLSTAKTVAPSSMTVDVMNAGSGVNGTAHQNSVLLQQQGFHIGAVGDSTTTSTSTTIEYPDGMQSQAKTLAAYVPGAVLQQVAGVSHVRLLLGSDGLNAKAKAATTTPTSPTAPKTSATSTPKPKAIDSGCIN
ncbi:MAG: cpsA, partial [Pseudonocardiales bacterium]|nr:cpsA [Pseudonocardiales bacterium]